MKSTVQTITEDLETVFAAQEVLTRMQTAKADAEREMYKAQCEVTNAVAALAKTIAKLPEPLLKELCRELDRAIPKKVRPCDFVVREDS